MHWKELFAKSRTCTILSRDNFKIYLVGDKVQCNKSLKRIYKTIDDLRPTTLFIETEPHDFQRWRKPVFYGDFLNDNYKKFASQEYANLSSQMINSYSDQMAMPHGYAILKNDDLKKQYEDMKLEYLSDDLTHQILSSSRSGTLEDLTLQFNEKFIRESRELNKQEQNEYHDEINQKFGQKVPRLGDTVRLYGMEGEKQTREEEQKYFDNLNSNVDELNSIATLIDDEYFDKLKYERIINNTGNGLNTIDDYELLESRKDARQASLNQLVRQITSDYGRNVYDDFWTPLKLLFAQRDRLLFRALKSRYNKDKKEYNTRDVVYVGFVNLVHIYGLEILWNDTEFWNSEDEVTSEDYTRVTDESRIKRALKDWGFPLF